jgi:hypothetical protein
MSSRSPTASPSPAEDGGSAGGASASRAGACAARFVPPGLTSGGRGLAHALDLVAANCGTSLARGHEPGGSRDAHRHGDPGVRGKGSGHRAGHETTGDQQRHAGDGHQGPQSGGMHDGSDGSGGATRGGGDDATGSDTVHGKGHDADHGNDVGSHGRSLDGGSGEHGRGVPDAPSSPPRPRRAFGRDR